LKLASRHIPVLLKETIELCNLKKGDIAIDATAGSGGHAIALLDQVGKKGTVVAVDIDPKSLIAAENRINDERSELAGNVEYVRANFADIEKISARHCAKAPQAIIADLGWRIEQIKDEERGMSLMLNQKLDMRLGGESEELSAQDIVNAWEEKQLAEVFEIFSDEREARKIAKAIVGGRAEKKIETTRELANIVAEAKTRSKKGIHPATQVFQALRMVVNNEVSNLEKLIDGAIKVLPQGGRFAVISFHSLEDRIIKNIFRINAGGCVCPKSAPVCLCGARKKIKKITKKPVRPSKEEIQKNPRSRSAKLRVIERLSG